MSDPTSACIERAQAAIDTTAPDLAAAQRQIETMTLDDLITLVPNAGSDDADLGGLIAIRFGVVPRPFPGFQ